MKTQWADDTPQAAIDILDNESGVKATAYTGGSILVQEDSDFDSITIAEFTRGTGDKIIRETGYAITGVRQKSEGEFQVWLDPLVIESRDDLTIAQRAVRILDNKENGTRFEANISDDPMEQYVDVFPDPHEQAAEDYSIKDDDMTRLRREGLQVRCMSCGRERGTYNQENYRIWFETQ